VFRQAARSGLKVLLLDRSDFAWGASSRSSKLIHGGLRYLRQGQIRLLVQSVRARETLLAQAPGLVLPMQVLMPLYRGLGPKPWHLAGGLALYDLIAMKRRSRSFAPARFHQVAPWINTTNLIGGVTYGDARVDDARLVLRLIAEGVAHGGVALNYVTVGPIARDRSEKARAVVVIDGQSTTQRTLSARVVVNATGSDTDRGHRAGQRPGRLRPLKGSHLILPSNVLPGDIGLSFFHPADGRPVFAFPWEGVVLAGTTDIDYEGDLSREPTVAAAEMAYLIEGLSSILPRPPSLEPRCRAVFAGVRPVWGGGAAAPSAEPRWHHIEAHNQVVTIVGGKLTTFGHVVHEALAAARVFLAGAPVRGTGQRLLDPVPLTTMPRGLSPVRWQRLCGRYGRMAGTLVATADPAHLEPVDGTPTLWAELAHAAANEWVWHLDDLLLRRVRIGLTLADGAMAFMPRIRALCGSCLGWDDARWEAEIRRYQAKWQRLHAPLTSAVQACPVTAP